MQFSEKSTTYLKKKLARELSSIKFLNEKEEEEAFELTTSSFIKIMRYTTSKFSRQLASLLSEMKYFASPPSSSSPTSSIMTGSTKICLSEFVGEINHISVRVFSIDASLLIEHSDLSPSSSSGSIERKKIIFALEFVKKAKEKHNFLVASNSKKKSDPACDSSFSSASSSSSDSSNGSSRSRSHHRFFSEELSLDQEFWSFEE